MKRMLWMGAAALAAAPAMMGQGYTLNGVSLGTNQVTMTIPKTGNAQSTMMLRLQYSGGNGANCNTGSLSEYFTNATSNATRAPAGVYMGYTSGPMSLPSSPSRGIAINVSSSAVPGTYGWTIVVPAGQCRGSNQTSHIKLVLVKAN